MSQDKLPVPATSGEIFQYATVVELRRLNDNLAALTATIQAAVMPEKVEQRGADEVTLKEPAEPVGKRRAAKQSPIEELPTQG